MSLPACCNDDSVCNIHSKVYCVYSLFKWLVPEIFKKLSLPKTNILKNHSGVREMMSGVFYVKHNWGSKDESLLCCKNSLNSSSLEQIIWLPESLRY